MNFQNLIVNNFFHLREIFFGQSRDKYRCIFRFRHPCFFPFFKGNIFARFRIQLIIFFFLLPEIVYLIENHHHRFLMRIDFH